MADDQQQEEEVPHRAKKQSEVEDAWLALLGKISVTLITHPLDYAKTLIQLGFEPLAPVPSHTLFRTPVLRLPGVFAYMRYLKDEEGFFGLYRGLTASLAHRMVNDIVLISVNANLPIVPSFDEDQVMGSEEDKLINFVKRQIHESTAYVVAIIVSHPLRVVAVRMMAQFIGKELKYTSIFGSCKEIIKDEGISGLWSGLLPRVYGEIARIWLAGTVAFFINNYIVEDPAVRSYITMTSSFLASSLTYPYGLVSTVMSVTGAPIAAGNPPRLANYDNWSQCWRHLNKLEQMKRGSSLFWRYHYPIIIRGGVAEKINVDLSVVSANINFSEVD